jgi:hypothetical protein
LRSPLRDQNRLASVVVWTGEARCICVAKNGLRDYTLMTCTDFLTPNIPRMLICPVGVSITLSTSQIRQSPNHHNQVYDGDIASLSGCSSTVSHHGGPRNQTIVSFDNRSVTCVVADAIGLLRGCQSSAEASAPHGTCILELVPLVSLLSIS